VRYSLDVPLNLNGHSSRCKWCANLLAPARRIWKVRDAHRYYCSELCFLQGEERQLRYAAQLAGTVHLHWTATLAVILSVLMVAFIFIGGTRAWAQDVDGTVHQKHPGHAQFHNIYKDWTLSNGRSSCCNGDDPERGTKGDCYPARAYPDEKGQWHVSTSRFRETRSATTRRRTEQSCLRGRDERHPLLC
jgi:hypothetical protein